MLLRPLFRVVCTLAFSFMIVAGPAQAQDEPLPEPSEAQVDTSVSQGLTGAPEDDEVMGIDPDASDASPSEEGWQEVVSEDGFYRVEMPGEPMETTEVTTSEFGPADVHLRLYEEDGIAYMSGHTVANEASTISEEQLVDGAVSRIISGERVTSVSDTSSFTFKGRPARSARIVRDELQMLWEYYAVGKRLYMVSVVSEGEIPEDDARRFLNSFDLTQPADTIAALPGGESPLKQLLGEIGWNYEVEDDGDYRLYLNVDSTRSQGAWIRPTDAERPGTPAGYEVYSQIMYADAPPSPSFMEAMLKRSGPLYGSFELFENADGEYLVFYSAFTPDVPDADALYNVVADVVTVADEMEKEWIGGDEY